MYEITTDKATEYQEFVGHALRVGADFTLSIRTADELRAVLEAIGGHNDYDPRKVATALGPLVGQMMRVRVEHFVAGPALYFELPFWSHQRIDALRIGGMGTKYTDDERKDMAAELRRVGRELGADEISVRQFDHEGTVEWRGTGERPREVRLWWD
jgi:hypothetical protein